MILAWSDAAPTAPGFYWFRSKPDAIPSLRGMYGIARVRAATSAFGEAYRVIDGVLGGFGLAENGALLRACEWAGPIEEPAS